MGMVFGRGIVNKFNMFVRVVAAGAALLPAAVLADDPRDPTMRNAAAYAHDHALVKHMNQAQLAYVRQRDVRDRRSHDESQSESDRAYAEARADYARSMASWRRAVAACNGGHWEYCAN